MMIPPAVFSSAAAAFTITLSCKGVTFTFLAIIVLIFVFELKPHPAITGFIGDGKGSLIIMPAVQIVKKLQFMAKPLSFLNSLSENQCKLKCQFFIFVASI